jgi:hypothetical protein
VNCDLARESLRRSGFRPRRGQRVWSFADSAVYRRAMIGDLHETLGGWVLEAPTEYVNGHPLGPRKVRVGHQPCTCRGSHLGRTCGATVYTPARGTQCRLVDFDGR